MKPIKDDGKHYVLEVEIPAIYTADIEALREYSEGMTESEFLLNVLGEPSVCRLRVETSGEKDSSVQEVWGYIRGARLEEASKGYRAGERMTDEQLAENGHRLMRDHRACEWCQYDDPADAIASSQEGE